MVYYSASLALTHSLADDHDGKVQNAEVRDYHDQYPLDFPLIAHDKMQTRVQYQSLPCHHAPPAHADDEADSIRLLDDEEVEEQEAERMEGTSER